MGQPIRVTLKLRSQFIELLSYMQEMSCSEFYEFLMNTLNWKAKPNLCRGGAITIWKKITLNQTNYINYDMGRIQILAKTLSYHLEIIHMVKKYYK